VSSLGRRTHTPQDGIPLPQSNGIEAAQQIRESCPSTQVILLSRHGSTEYVFRFAVPHGLIL